IGVICCGVGFEFALRNRVLLWRCLKIRGLRWTVLIDSSLVGWTVLIEIVSLKTILVVILLSRLMKSRRTCLIRNILTILNEISDCCGLKLLDVIMKYGKIMPSSSLEFALRNRVLLWWCLKIKILLWTVLIDSSLVWLTVLILIEIIALEMVLVVVLMSRLIKSRWTHLVRNILTVLNEIADGCGLKLLDVIVNYWKIISSSTSPRGMQQSAEDRKNLSEKKKEEENSRLLSHREDGYVGLVFRYIDLTERD
nr:hypothetical protein [Tanacetum cinerariifolium]